MANVFLRNEGDGTFRDLSSASGVADSPGKALGIAFNDADGDGLPDVIVANDAVAQQLFLNRGPGAFIKKLNRAQPQGNR